MNKNIEINNKILEILAKNKLEQLQGKSIKYADFDKIMFDLTKSKDVARNVSTVKSNQKNKSYSTPSVSTSKSIFSNSSALL